MSIHSILNWIGGHLLSEKIKARCKRVIFMTTLYLEFKHIQDPSKLALDEVNEKLGLVTNPDVLKLPAVLQAKIWKPSSKEAMNVVDTDIANGNYEEACKKVIAITPKWLQYGTKDGAMFNDIETIAREVSGRRVAHG